MDFQCEMYTNASQLYKHYSPIPCLTPLEKHGRLKAL